MSEWEKILELEQLNDSLKQRIFKLQHEIETLKQEREMNITQINYWQYLADIEREKREKLENKIVRLDKIVDSFLKEDK